MNIELIRGDTLDLKFQRKLINNEVITSVPDEMYFTVKNNYNEDDYLIQKRLGESITYNEEDHYYYFTIESVDTDNLGYNSYVYDIEIVKDGKVKTILKGKLKIKQEVTFATNRTEV